MIYQGFCGPSNPTQSAIADVERTMNWYPEQIQSPYAPTSRALFPTPGQQDYIEIPNVNMRALFAENGRCFAVCGDGFYEIFFPAARVLRGLVAQDDNPATISSNGVAGDQLFITSGGNGYCYDLSTNTLTTELIGEATMGGMKDGYFLAFNANNGQVRLSDLNDGTTWDPTNFFARSIAPDPWKAMIVGNPQIWMIGENTSEAWYNAQASVGQPFAPILSSFIRWGTSAPFSVKLAGDMLTFLSHTEDGAGVIVGGQGYSLQPISNYAVNTSIAATERAYGIDDCETLVYQEDGHLFACFTFAAGNSTWVYDVGSGDWHERGSWNTTQTRYDYWHPRVHCHAFGKHLVGERATGMLSEMDNTFGSEADGGVIRRLRIPPPLWASPRQRVMVSRFTLMMDVGLGLSSGQGSDPTVMLRVSYDGRTWGNERWASAGPMGQYSTQVEWLRCGSSEKLWVPEIVVTDPVPWRISAADLDGSGFYRLAKAS